MIIRLTTSSRSSTRLRRSRLKCSRSISSFSKIARHLRREIVQYRVDALAGLIDAEMYVVSTFIESQWKAFTYLKASPNDEKLIQGLPETGKSFFITRWLPSLLKIAERETRKDEKHLICAHSNGAINNLADNFGFSNQVGFSTLYEVIIYYATTELLLFLRTRNRHRLWNSGQYTANDLPYFVMPCSSSRWLPELTLAEGRYALFIFPIDTVESHCCVEPKNSIQRNFSFDYILDLLRRCYVA